MSFFESERLRFRALEPDDAERMAELLNDPRVRRFLDHRVFPLTTAAERTFLEGLGAGTGPKTDVIFGVTLPNDDALIGASGLHHIHPVSRMAEWGLLVEPDHWGYGYGQEIGVRMLRYAFEDLNLNRVYLRVNVGHPAGVRAYEAAGFIKEGLLRQTTWLEGRYHDTFVMAALRDEWRPPTRKKRR
ncbi:MAG: GNAT family N-acetyltransferase [Deltaproteobacteria bacterium]|nr:GNAT family N-acetyltransferase [Deltaproteobacteria bacterium]